MQPSAEMEIRHSKASGITFTSVPQVSTDSFKEEVDLEPENKLDETYFTLEQVSMIRQMLQEECSSFLSDENDLGYAHDLELDIQSEDKTLVGQAYRSVPPPLYQELKDYILDMLNKGFTKKSTSAYSSPMVYARKKKSTSVHRLSLIESEEL